MQNSHICEYCNESFSRKDALVRHIRKKRCKMQRLESIGITPEEVKELLKNKQTKKITLKKLTPEINTKNDTIQDNSKFVTESDLKQLELRLAEKLKRELEQQKPNNITNNLQIVCVGNNDNYLDMLTDQWQSFDKALEYIKNCALSQLLGDCKLIEKIYMSGEQSSIKYTDKSRTKIEYLNEKEEVVRDTKELFGKKIANNLQNSYLKGVNYLITKNLTNRRCPNKFLEDYDLQTWNQHIFDLSDSLYQKKMVNNLNIM